MSTTDQLRFPVGEFMETQHPNQATLSSWIDIIADFPNKLQNVVEGLTEQQLNQSYRPGGWTIKQVIHHCADSHLNAYIRFKLALTEDGPNIKPYDEAAWAELPDTLNAPIGLSLQLLAALHARWAILLTHLAEEGLQKKFYHPEHGTAFTLLLAMDNYQWHCRHHLAHIELAKAHF